MKPILNRIIAVLIGVIVASFTLVLGESLLGKIWEAPTGINQDLAAYYNYIASLPLKAFIALWFAYIVASFIGGYTAARISKTQKAPMALVVGIALMIAGIFNFQTFKHPTIFVVITCISYILFAYLGGVLAKRLSVI